MTNDDMMTKVMAEVMRRISDDGAPAPPASDVVSSSLSEVLEFVGINKLGDSIGLVIPNITPEIMDKMPSEKKFRSVGILGARVGAGPQVFAADEAIKATNSQIVTVEFARDTKGGAGHGSLIVFGAEDVSDARRAVNVALKELDRTFGDVYGCDAGHLEFQYTARASRALEKVFGAPLGKAFGITVGAPAAIGIVMADTAVKASDVDIVAYSSPASGTSFSNEVIAAISGDSGAVKQAIVSARDVGMKLLGAFGEKPESMATPYI